MTELRELLDRTAPPMRELHHLRELLDEAVREKWNASDNGDSIAYLSTLVDIVKAQAERIGALEELIGINCPSCAGLNISHPEGCGRDPLTGELDGSTLEPAPSLPFKAVIPDSGGHPSYEVRIADSTGIVFCKQDGESLILDPDQADQVADAIKQCVAAIRAGMKA